MQIYLENSLRSSDYNWISFRYKRLLAENKQIIRHPTRSPKVISILVPISLNRILRSLYVSGIYLDIWRTPEKWPSLPASSTLRWKGTDDEKYGRRERETLVPIPPVVSFENMKCSQWAWEKNTFPPHSFAVQVRSELSTTRIRFTGLKGLRNAHIRTKLNMPSIRSWLSRDGDYQAIQRHHN